MYHEKIRFHPHLGLSLRWPFGPTLCRGFGDCVLVCGQFKATPAMAWPFLWPVLGLRGLRGLRGLSLAFAWPFLGLRWPFVGPSLALPWHCLALRWPLLGLTLALRWPWPLLGLSLALRWPFVGLSLACPLAA